MADELSRLSEELAGDPGSLAFLRLGELLRLRGDLADAARIAARGRDRHPTEVAAYDLVARIAADMGDVAAATAAWEQLVQLDPRHAGALKGLAFVAFRDGRMGEAAAHLQAAAAAAPDDASIAAALVQVRAAAAAPAPPAVGAAGAVARRSSVGLALFDDLRADAETVLLLDAAGQVLAASVPRDDAAVGTAIGVSLAGVSDEATRATRHLGLGSWTAFTIEGERASACLAPAPGDGVVVVTAPRGAAMGAVRRVLQEAATRVRALHGDAGTP
jgi:predicted regulator of Ras-like GTPase activity (Roadblock/LC7/MglB family)